MVYEVCNDSGTRNHNLQSKNLTRNLNFSNEIYADVYRVQSTERVQLDNLGKEKLGIIELHSNFIVRIFFHIYNPMSDGNQN